MATFGGQLRERFEGVIRLRDARQPSFLQSDLVPIMSPRFRSGAPIGAELPREPLRPSGASSGRSHVVVRDTGSGLCWHEGDLSPSRVWVARALPYASSWGSFSSGRLYAQVPHRSQSRIEFWRYSPGMEDAALTPTFPARANGVLNQHQACVTRGCLTGFRRPSVRPTPAARN
jgi:hypothetical protein